MWKSKKFVLLSALALALLIGSVSAGVTFAQSGDDNAPPAIGNESQPGDREAALLSETATILGLDEDTLKDAFSQARTELQNEVQSGSGNETHPEGHGAPYEALLSKVATILGIDEETLKDAFSQARTEMQTEALQGRLQELVEQGKITQEQADAYLAWWNSKPDIGIDVPLLPGLCGGGGMMMGGRGPGFVGGDDSGTIPQMPDLGSGNSTVPQSPGPGGPGFGGRG